MGKAVRRAPAICGERGTSALYRRVWRREACRHPRAMGRAALMVHAARGSYAYIQSIPLAVTGSSSFSMRSRIQAPVAPNSRLLLPLRRAAHDLLCARTALGLEILEGYAKLLPVLHQPAEPHGVFERSERLGRHADWWRARRRRSEACAGAPGRQGRDVERRCHHDIFGCLRMRGYRIVPAFMEIEQMPLDCVLAHGAKFAASVPCEGCVLHHITPSAGSELQKP